MTGLTFLPKYDTKEIDLKIQKGRRNEMKKTFLIFLMAAIVFVVIACVCFSLGVGYGRFLEREITAIKVADPDAEELQRWEKQWEVRYAARGLES